MLCEEGRKEGLGRRSRLGKEKGRVCWDWGGEGKIGGRVRLGFVRRRRKEKEKEF